MQSLFELVPDNLFSPLASHNRRLYFRVLMVVRDCYQHELRFRRTDLARYLIHHLEDDLYRFRDDLDVDTTADEASATTTATAGSTVADDPDVPATLSARAFAIIRRLVETGWLRAIPDDQTFDELLIVPDYASALMDTFHAIVHPAERPYNAFVFGTYSALKTANEERGDYMFPGLQSAYDNIDALTKSLRALLDNIHRFYQSLQRQSEVRDLLAEHFDEYQTLVAARTYHPLKTVDSVHRFRPRILQILRGWLLDGEVLEQLATSARIHRAGLDDVDETLQRWADRGVVALKWVKHEAGNMLDRVYLQPAGTGDAYALLGRTPKAADLERIAAELTWWRSLPCADWMQRWLDDVEAVVRTDRRLLTSLIFAEDDKRALLLQALHGLVAKGDEELSVRRLEMVDMPVRRVLTIENKANYRHYVADDIQADELVVYLGGFHSPGKRLFLRQLREAVTQQGASVAFHHWGDLDYGGILILQSLRDAVLPELMPWRMEPEWLQKLQAYVEPFDDAYREKLALLLRDRRYELHWALVDKLLEIGGTLEQEAFLV